MAGENQITVNNITFLTNLGTSSQTASQFYVEETKNAHQSFQLRTEGNEGVAIEAFVDKINNLSNQVFAVYPGLLSDFASAISNYSGVLTGAGFSDKVFTDSGDIDNIKTWLSTQRYNSISSKGKELDGAFKEASAALAKSPNSVDYSADTKSIVSVALENLTHRASVYQSKHNTLMSGKHTFSSELDTVNTGLKQIQSFLNNALYLSQMDTGVLINWVQNGILTKDNMGYLDSVQDKNDGKVLKILLSNDSNKEKMDQLGKVNPENTSQAMMNHVYGKTYQLLDDYKSSGDADNIEAIDTFLVSITGNGHSQDYVKTYMTKLSAGGVIFATAITGQATSVMPDLDKYNGNYDAYISDFNKAQKYISEQLSPKLTTAQEISGLFDTVRLKKFGRAVSPNKIHIGQSKWESESSEGLKKGSLVFDSEKGNFEFKSEKTTTYQKIGPHGSILNENKTSYDTINTNYYKNPDDVLQAQTQSELKELKEDRETAVKNYWKDMAKTGSGYILPPGFDTVANIAIDMTSIKETDDYVDILDEGTSLYSGKYEGGFNTSKDALKHVIDLNSEINKIDEQIQDKETRSHALFYGVGGVTHTNQSGSDTGGVFQSSYDMQSILYADDIEKNGMRGYILRKAASEEQCSDGIRERVKEFDTNLDESQYSKSEQTFLKGQSSQSLKDMGTSKVSRIFQKMDRPKFNFGNYDYEEYHKNAIDEFEKFS